MKIILELSDRLFRKAEATAAACGQSLKEFVTEALRDKLLPDGGRTRAEEPEWMQGFGKLSICTRKPSACNPSSTGSSKSSNPGIGVDSRYLVETSTLMHYRMCDGSVGKVIARAA